MRSFTNLKIYLLGLAFVLVSFLSYGQTAASGQVTDSDGEALAGATVLQNGTTNGTVADLDAIKSTDLHQKKLLISMYPIL